MTRTLATSLVLATFLTGTAFAGAFSDFEHDMRSAYADYRVALFATNANKPDEAHKAIAAFQQKWAALATMETPPQYEDETGFKSVLTDVATIAEAADAKVTAAALAEAHETLEGIREKIASLHVQAGLTGFSDRMNAYHAKMEAILGKTYNDFDAAGLSELHEDAAVLTFLLDDIKAHPAPEAGDEAYAALLDAVNAATGELLQATRDADAVGAKAAIGGLKVPYSKFFLKFG